MTEPPVTTKGRMYELLRAGAFGNTVPQYMSLAAWRASGDAERYGAWGVRTLVAGGPCRLYCPRDEVEETASRPAFARAGINVSVMLDAVRTVTLMADIYDSPDKGLLVYGVERPRRGANWRMAMPTEGRQYGGLSARMLLARHLNESDVADLWAIFERWPGHVVELSACEVPFGTVPGRRGVVWEVRESSGAYERSSWGHY